MKIIRIIPFLTILLIVLYTWVEIIAAEHIATWRHYVALALVLVNAALYFVRYKQALLLTGIILVLAAFNLMAFFPAITTYGLIIAGVNSPEMQMFPLLVLIVYVVINFNFLVDWRLDWKEEKARRKMQK